ncbi:hypothetical protein CC78DRAFT_121320 [Lojkania enalia]|uniref:Uncharacterized protein n=1 Tax=Lojkania enalia TaxID=147567 RepID=A0A9P4KI15_9PLEO|nr:hypothetical protein CC78DRAFT_121320 [Didymosphaeria enalia]
MGGRNFLISCVWSCQNMGVIFSGFLHHIWANGAFFMRGNDESFCIPLVGRNGGAMHDRFRKTLFSFSQLFRGLFDDVGIFFHIWGIWVTTGILKGSIIG